MATPGYPQEDKEERRAPCLAPNFCNTSRIDPWKWRDHAALSNWWRMQQKHCDIVTCVWLFATAKRWSKTKTQCKFPLYETDDVGNRHPFFWGHGIIGSLVRFHHRPCVTSAEIISSADVNVQVTVREQLRKNSGPFLSQGGSPPKLCDFCTVFAVFGRR